MIDAQLSMLLVQTIYATKDAKLIEAFELIADQALNSEKLETKLAVVELYADYGVDQANTLKEKNTQLREALEFYASSENYQVNLVDQWGPEINVMIDGGNKAHKALEEIK
ncbi:hypothetical protein C7437_1011039 [Psychrobacillus insolitus]|uniref:Uncharacterized protein n=1 Tax=Psychrobacillus insolitus TaxID=1461 RepID=A0A2W7ML74_9BACI|nr:hypothetical protein [Psychrobacillus insolitus]PZX07917.1 hypothetical protein C7437_1011039 [Psychrobacillus insolitus]